MERTPSIILLIAAILAALGMFLVLETPWVSDRIGPINANAFFIGTGAVLYCSFLWTRQPAHWKYGVEAAQAWGAGCIYGALCVVGMVVLSELDRRLRSPGIPRSADADRGFALAILLWATIGSFAWVTAWTLRRAARHPSAS